jgi:hypothetical protein
MAYVTFAGDFLKLTEVDIIRPIESVLTAIGEEASQQMKKLVEPHRYKGRLEESITWRTAKNQGGSVKSEDLIKAPPVHCVDIGSANDHAFYVNNGTGPHNTPKDADMFVTEVMAWAKSKGFTEQEGWAIIRSIHNEGTMHDKESGAYIGGLHYKETMDSRMRSIARPICRDAIRTFWAKQKQV